MLSLTDMDSDNVKSESLVVNLDLSDLQGHNVVELSNVFSRGKLSVTVDDIPIQSDVRHEYLQRRLRDWKGAVIVVEKAVSDAELGKTPLSRQIRMASRRGQADVMELGHTLSKDIEFRLCSSCSGIAC